MQTIKLNLIPGGVLPVVNVSQYDVGRQFAIQVYEGAASYSLTGKSVQIRGTKPDGNGFAYDSTDGAISVSGNTVTVTTLQQMTACGGQVMCELRITASGVVLGTLNFILAVETSALSDDTPISNTDIPAIERDFQAALDEAEADALIAEGYAKGTQNGTPVGSGEPYYQDNAKYYKEQADIDATNAGNSATSAEADALKSEGYAIGKQNGSPVSSGSPYYQNNAEYHDTHASEQAYNASQSANSASGSATSANTNALKSEGFAVGEQNGAPVASGSPYYQNNAAYYAAQAAQYATGGLIYKGSIAFASLPTTGLSNGDMYNITDDFTTDNRFVEGAGITVKAGSNIAYIAGGVDKWDILATGGGVSDMSDLQDVSLSSLADGDLLQYNGTATKWKNSQAIPNALGAVRDAGAVNQIPFPYYGTAGVYGNITYTVSEDGVVNANGTANATSTFSFLNRIMSKNNFKPGQRVILKGCPSGGGANKYFLRINRTWGGVDQVVADDYGDGVEFTVPETENGNFGLFFRAMSGESFTNVKIKPMLYDAAIGPDVPYQPYAMTNRELTEEVDTLDSLINTKLTKSSFLYKTTIPANSSVDIPLTYQCTMVIFVVRHDIAGNVYVYTGHGYDYFYQNGLLTIKQSSTKISVNGSKASTDHVLTIESTESYPMTVYVLNLNI